MSQPSATAEADTTSASLSNPRSRSRKGNRGARSELSVESVVQRFGGPIASTSGDARTERVTTMLSENELDDLRTLSQSLSVPVSSLIWGVVRDWIDEARVEWVRHGEREGSLMLAAKMLARTESGRERLRALLELEAA
jgi:hypothetical protein